MVSYLVFLHHPLFERFDLIPPKVIFTFGRSDKSFMILFQFLMVVSERINLRFAVIVGAQQTPQSICQLILEGTSIVTTGIDISLQSRHPKKIKMNFEWLFFHEICNEWKKFEPKTRKRSNSLKNWGKKVLGNSTKKLNLLKNFHRNVDFYPNQIG